MTAMLASVATRPTQVQVETSRQVEVAAPAPVPGGMDFASTLNPVPPAGFGPPSGFGGSFPGAPGGPPASPGSTAAQVTVGVATGLLSALPGGAAIAARLGGDPQAAQMQQLWQMQREAQAFNSQYLYLQEALQKDAREFTARSNLSKAMHETMKGTLGNIGR
jgi:hypothetical protein